MRWTLTLGFAFGLAGCLFPSFDDLKGEAPSQTSEHPTETADEPTTTTPSIPTTPAATDSGTQAPPATEKAAHHVACDELSCDLESTVCCFDFSWKASCAKPGTQCPGGKLPCDDDNDCGGGQACCRESPGSFNTVCRAGGCGTDDHVCEPGGPSTQCGAGTTCSGHLYKTIPKPGICQ